MKPINLKFCTLFKININFDFSLLYPRKNGLRRKSKGHWILRLSNQDYGYLILKFSALAI